MHLQQTQSFGDFTLDYARARLLCSGREVKLRPKSYEVLKYLVDNPARIVTKDELIKAVWSDSFVTDDSLVQCLRDVRRALGGDAQQYIKTVPRRGYIFEPDVTKPGPKTSDAVFVESVEGVRLVIEEPIASQNLSKEASAEGLVTHHTFLTKLGKKRLAQALTVLMIPGIVALSYLWISSRRSTSTDPSEPNTMVRSIAVLPFKPLSDDEDTKDLGLGMADTLITRLSGLRAIIVRPTSAVQKYTSSDQDSLDAGREQMVDAVLEGSIQRSVDRLRVTVRLMNVRDGSSLWADKYDERSTEIFALQDAISEKVAGALALKLSGNDKLRLAKRYTANLEAFQLYVRGVFLRNQMTEEGLKKSAECFQKAIELDPNYALAYAGQASSISPLAWFGDLSVKEVESRNRPLITKALELDNTLPEAHAALGEFKLFFDWDWDGAEREFKRALELNPSEQLTHLLYPDLLLIKGRTEEAISLSKSAVEIDPVSPRVGKAAADIYFLAGQYDRAIEQFNKIRELFPDYRLIQMGPSYEQKGMYDQAIQEYLSTEERWGMRKEEIGALRHAYAVKGWRGYWEKRLELAKGVEKESPARAVYLAELHARLGEKDQALELLEEAYAERHPSLIFLNIAPTWESLRADPRFIDLLRRIGINKLDKLLLYKYLSFPIALLVAKEIELAL